MRIIMGKWGGRTLTSPGQRVRPTGEGVREAWLGALEEDLAGARCVDLFAGCGSVGLEALSRGALSCDFVENGPGALHSLKANMAKMKPKANARIFKRDAIPFVQNLDKVAYDIVFADPPYGSRKLDRIIEQWRDQPYSRILSVEHALDHPTVLPSGGTSLEVGASGVTIYRL
jgi:16S rRNA (guanine966-N2)-methyltransferase